MIATTISNSMSEKPFSRLRIIDPPLEPSAATRESRLRDQPIR
jgi:hypothetical protein